MQNWKYTSIIVLVLLGGISYFGYWAFNQNKLALDLYDVSYSQLSTSFAAYTKVILDRTTAIITDTSGIATTSPDISLTFPVTGDKVYIGCNYKIAWETSTTTPTSTPSTIVKSLDIALVDAETQEATGPIASGLSATSTATGLEYLDWKVGNIWPGEFYVLISRINGIEKEIKSKYFMINKMTEGISADEREIICK